MMLGVGLLTQLNLGPIVNTVIGASLLVLGSGLAASLLGATP